MALSVQPPKVLRRDLGSDTRFPLMIRKAIIFVTITGLRRFGASVARQIGRWR
jgi:hypothetical protein